MKDWARGEFVLRTNARFPEVPRLSPREVQRRVDAGRAVVVDVRRTDAFESGHIPGAQSAPARTVVARDHDLPRDRELILY